MNFELQSAINQLDSAAESLKRYSEELERTIKSLKDGKNPNPNTLGLTTFIGNLTSNISNKIALAICNLCEIK